MDAKTQVSSPLELILERMRKWDGSPWGRLQILSHQWLTRIENHPLIQSYGTLLRRSRESIGLRSESAINVDSVFPFSLIFHLLLIFFLGWTAISSIALPKPGPIRVRFIDIGTRPKRQPKKITKAAKPKVTRVPQKVAPPQPAPKPKKVLPPLPAPKILAKSPRVAPAIVTAEPTEALIQLPTSQSRAVESLQLKVETPPGATVSKVSEDELKILKGVVQGLGLPAVEGSPSAIQSPDFAPYLEKIKRKVELVWEDPEGIAGIHQVTLVFVLDRGGKLVRAEVLDSKNAKIDRSALTAMRAASPFPAIPESLKDLAGWPIRIKFTFEVKVAK
ncbi:MAG: energy transducer TonB [Candidatus Binatia bacterium]